MKALIGFNLISLAVTLIFAIVFCDDYKGVIKAVGIEIVVMALLSCGCYLIGGLG